MKGIRISLMAVLLLAVAACTKTDKERLTGTWQLQEIIAGKEHVFSRDPKQQQRIIDRIVAQQQARLPEEAWGQLDMMRTFFQRNMKAMEKATLTIKANDTFVARSLKGINTQPETGGFTVNEPQHELHLKGNVNETFHYKLTSTKLELTTAAGNESLKLVFKHR